MERNTIVLKALVGNSQGSLSLTQPLACSIILRRLSKVTPNNAKTHRFVITCGYTLAFAFYIGYQFTCYTEFINLSMWLINIFDNLRFYIIMQFSMYDIQFVIKLTYWKENNISNNLFKF